jgi:hypothetical protein
MARGAVAVRGAVAAFEQARRCRDIDAEIRQVLH